MTFEMDRIIIGLMQLTTGYWLLAAGRFYPIGNGVCHNKIKNQLGAGNRGSLQELAAIPEFENRVRFSVTPLIRFEAKIY